MLVTLLLISIIAGCVYQPSITNEVSKKPTDKAEEAASQLPALASTPTSVVTNMPNNNSSDKLQINEALLEIEIKNAIIKIAKEEIYGPEYENAVYAEGHRTWKYEIKSNKIYAYVSAEYGTYTKENGIWYITTGSAGPLVIIFNIKSSNNYDYAKVIEAEPGDEATLESKIFPSDIVSQAEGVDYQSNFFQDQIKKYLD